MQNTSQNNRHRLNVLDILLILLAVALVAGLVYLIIISLPNDMSSKGEWDINYSVVVESLPADISAQLHDGNERIAIYDYETGVFLGIIQSASSKNHKLIGYDSVNGNTPVINTVPDSYDLTVTVQATGTYNGSEYAINGITIVSGRTLILKTNTVYLEGICTLNTVTRKQQSN